MDLKKSIRDRCHVNTNDNGDSFVGVRADTDDAIIYFPIGYQLSKNDNDLRMDIINLFTVLSTFMKEDSIIETSKYDKLSTVKFPINAYLHVIRDFLRRGTYYIEKESQYHTDKKGKPSWSRTIREQKALVQKNGSLIFTNMTVRSVAPNSNKEITQIHRLCVYEAFEKIGWLYVPFMPENPGNHPSVKESIHILDKKLVTTNNDVEQVLFNAMRNMLIYIDERSSENQYLFGTYFFETIWERMVDVAFGIHNKRQYFPRTRWILDYGMDKVKRPLQPDTIMIYRDKLYVLDAKLYRYGCDPKPDNLPNSGDVNKQITYAEYIEKEKKVPNDKLYNAFVMPYNKENNLFNLNSNIGNIGEAVSEWKLNTKYYEHIQGIVIDTRYLMYNYISTSENQKKEMAECIEKVLIRAPINL